jgi:uridylate kinase
MNKEPIYKRVILKLSGEALAGPLELGIDFAVLHYLAEEILPLVKLDVELGIVVGGGNFFRGANAYDDSLGRVTGDHMGMIATIINALAMRDAFEQHHIKAQVMSSLPVRTIVEEYDHRKASCYLHKKEVVIFAGGTGNPLVTTDFALGLRGVELKADLLLKATNVDGIYTADPRKDSKAKHYKHLTYNEAVARELAVMDLGAFCLCRDHGMRLRVFNIRKHGALLNIIMGKEEGTLVENV